MAKKSDAFKSIVTIVDKINTQQLLYVLLLMAAFLLGYFFAKVQYLEKGTFPAAPSQSTTGQIVPTVNPQVGTGSSISKQDVKKWAQAIGLDVNKFNSCFDANKYKSAVDQDATDGRTAGVSGTPSFFINGTLLVGAQPFSGFKEAIDKALNGTQGSVKVDNGHLPLLGSKNASVTMVEFSDLQCPFCRRFFKDAFPQIKKEYLDTGKVALYFRHFPLDFHPAAPIYAEAVECANEQNKFWELHDKIYDEQEKLGQGTIQFTP